MHWVAAQMCGSSSLVIVESGEVAPSAPPIGPHVLGWFVAVCATAIATTKPFQALLDALAGLEQEFRKYL
jgi:hypothetical protein